MELSKNNKNLSITRQEIIDIEKTLINLADNKNIIANGGDIVYHDKFKYKHTFADGIYVREMTMKKGQLGFSAIHKHSYAFFLLSGVLASSKEEGVEEFIAPCYIISPQGAKRIVYAVEDCVITTVNANPTNTRDLKEIEEINVAFNWEEYEEYLKSQK